MPSKAVYLVIAAVAQGVAAVGVGVTHMGTTLDDLVGALSVGSIVTAVGSIFVMREKIARTEKDFSGHRDEQTKALERIATEFAIAMREHRQELREDNQSVREKVDQLAEAVARVEGHILMCPVNPSGTRSRRQP